MDFTTYSRDIDYSMPMICYEEKEISNNEALNKRFCLIIIESGNGMITINDKSYPFIAPVLFCINESERVVIDKKYNVNIKAIFFHPSIINSILTFENIRKNPDDFPMTAIQDSYLNKYFIDRTNNYYGKINIGPLTYRRIEALFFAFKRETTMQNTDNWPCRSRSFLIEVLFLLDNVFGENEFLCNDVAIDDEELQQILIYLFNNYNRKITISDLTKEFNINRTTLSEKFSNFIGESIITYLNKLRVKMASIILRDTKLPISEVMERVGFNDSTHFFRTFKKYFGVSPKEYREKYCWMA